MRKHRAGLVALLCVAAGVVLLLLAVDARSWHATVARDDLRFRALPAHTDLWRPATTLPGDPAGALLGTSDTIAYRRALQLFWYSRVGANPQERQDLPTLRAEAQQHLQSVVGGATTSQERSLAANLLGVLTVTTPTSGQDSGGVSQILKRAAGYFQQAIRLDDTNTQAKLNLELVLRISHPGKGRISKEARSGYGFGVGRGSNRLGGGY